VDCDADDIIGLLDERAHLVGTSMGAVVAGRASALVPSRVLSLTLIEPPALINAKDIPAVAETAAALRRHWEDADRDDVVGFIQGFLKALGIEMPLPSSLPPHVLTAARNLMTEAPWEMSIPTAALDLASFKTAVVSGTSCAAFEAICDRLADQAHAVRRVFPGAGHAVQRIGGPFNTFLENFLLAAPA
jgi:pimeloyl-ACP methyl ester carboxylesterase